MNSKQLETIKIIVIDNMLEEDIINYWNKYLKDNDKYIYDNEESFFEDNFTKSFDAVRAVIYGDYNLNEKYVIFNGQGNLDSFNYIADMHCPIDLDELAKSMYDNQDYMDINYYLDFKYSYEIARANELNCEVEDISDKIDDFLKNENPDFNFMFDDWTELDNIITF